MIRKLLPFIARIGADPNDGDDERLRKTLLVGGALMFIAAGAVWGLMYFAFGELLAGVIPLSRR